MDYAKYSEFDWVKIKSVEENKVVISWATVTEDLSLTLWTRTYQKHKDNWYYDLKRVWKAPMVSRPKLIQFLDFTLEEHYG